VLVAGLQHHDSIYGQKSFKPYYTYGCNSLLYDPDHPIYGLPDIEIKVSLVNIYEPKLSGLLALKAMGISDKPQPYKIFRKPVYDSTGKKLNILEMQLWLTQFKVAVTVISDRDKPQVRPDHESMNARIYPGKWYGDSRRWICINDLRDRDECNNHRYSDIIFILEVNPNASPWYIKTGNEQTLKSDIAVGAVICSEIIKRPENENQIHVNIQKGMLVPLYFEPFDVSQVSALAIDSVSGVGSEIKKLLKMNIWNRKYYMKIHSKNIGSRKTGILWNKRIFDEQLEFTFLLPLFVVGSWDVQLPWEVIPAMEAPKPYYKSFTISNLFPNWGLKGFGRIFSGILLAAIIFFAAVWFLPLFRR